MCVQNKQGWGGQGGCFLALSFLIINQYCAPKMCSKQVGGCFLVYYVTFLIQKMCVQSKRGAAF